MKEPVRKFQSDNKIVLIARLYNVLAVFTVISSEKNRLLVIYYNFYRLERFVCLLCRPDYFGTK